MDFPFFCRLAATGILTALFALSFAEVLSANPRRIALGASVTSGSVAFIAVVGMIWTAFK